MSPRELKQGGASLVRVEGRVFWSQGPRVIKFITAFCIHTNARWAGEPFVLLPWQKQLILELFEVDPDTGLRVYRRALIGLPRKSGKTELAYALACYLAFGDGEKSAEVYCAASSEDQADMVFKAIHRACNPDEMPAGPLSEFTDVSVSRISLKGDSHSFIERLSSKGKTKHGLNIHGVILDELHVWGVGEHAELWAALTTGSAARLQPMQIAITTAGTDKDESRCGALYELGRRIERGEQEAGGFFFRWWQAPEHQCVECGRYLYDGEKCAEHPWAEQAATDWTDPVLWAMASPSYGYTVMEGFYADELASTTEADFRRLYLNQWLPRGSTPWLKPGQWEVLAVGAFELRPGQATWVGVDLSETRDSTGVAWGQLWDGDDRPCGHTGESCLYVKAREWASPLLVDGRPDPEYQIPQAEVKGRIRELNAEYSVPTNVFDPWHSKLMRQDLEAEGMPVEEIWQTGSRRSGATASLFDRIVQRRLHHDGDPALARHISNATTKQASGGEGYYLAKRKRGAVMDLAMALVNVEYGVMYAAPKPQKAGVTWV